MFLLLTLNKQIPAGNGSQAEDVKSLYKKKKTELADVPSGCTSCIQPLDVFFP